MFSLNWPNNALFPRNWFASRDCFGNLEIFRTAMFNQNAGFTEYETQSTIIHRSFALRSWVWVEWINKDCASIPNWLIDPITSQAYSLRKHSRRPTKTLNKQLCMICVQYDIGPAVPVLLQMMQGLVGFANSKIQLRNIHSVKTSRFGCTKRFDPFSPGFWVACARKLW